MKSQTTYIIIGVVLLVLIFIGISSWEDREVTWDEHYDTDSKDPYGLYLVRNLFNTLDGIDTVYFSEQRFSEFLEEKDIENANYFLVGSNFYMDSLSLMRFREFIERGNKAFISVKNFPYIIDQEILINCENAEGTTYDSTQTFSLVHFNHKRYTYDFVEEHEPRLYFWNHIDMNSCPGYFEGAEVLGINKDGEANFIKFPLGEGAVYFHSTPLAFTNYALKDNLDHLDYAEKLLSYLDDKPVIWDQFSSVPYYYSPLDNQVVMPEKKSPISFILSNKSLRWAWYLLVGLIVLYVAVFSKRKQRVIPILEKPSNTSVEFTETIGALYFQQQNHRKVARHMYRLFLHDLREKYKVRTNVITDKTVEEISKKSGIDINSLNDIFNYYNFLKKGKGVKEKELMEFHQKLDGFYKKADK